MHQDLGGHLNNGTNNLIHLRCLQLAGQDCENYYELDDEEDGDPVCFGPHPHRI